MKVYRCLFNQGRWFILILLLLAGCRKDHVEQEFSLIPASHSNVQFHNTLTETEYFNIIEYLYFYNGGGVAAGDINNDGLVDLFFTANQLQNRLYLNKGDFVFEDITEKAGIPKKGNWSTGVAMGDVNGDGLLDIFVCGVGNYKYFNGSNQLLINNGDLTFSDQTDAYGLTFEGFSTHACFFDFDNDGDLDLYLLNHSVHSAGSYGEATQRYLTDSLAGDKLYRNELVPLGKPEFTEVTSSSGILSSRIAYGLGVGVADLNSDGLRDIYISNDFHENDYLYINKGDGHFEEQLRRSIAHTSRFSMGNDIADVNNDGWQDIITLDMLPRDEEVIKTTAGEDSYEIYAFKLRYGYHHQFARNTLQLSQGLASDGTVLFSEIAALSGVEASDWSWAPLLADFDNDGFKDLFIANGILNRPNDLDYINFISTDSAQRFYSYEKFIERMPPGRVPNVFFNNINGLQFEDVTSKWIGNDASLATGAAYADLDNDGDLDLVVNNINAPASIYRNDLVGGGWLQVELHGEGYNRFGIGCKVIIYSAETSRCFEQSLSRGWQSSVSSVINVGLGDDDIDSVVVIWPDGKFQKLYEVKKNSRLTLLEKDASGQWQYTNNLFANRILSAAGEVPFAHEENTYNAFNREKLIPRMLSTEGPDISVADLNNDGRDDLFVCGASGQPGGVFWQTPSGTFSRMVQPDVERDAACEDVGSAFFDANGDGAIDLMVVSGGQEITGDDSRLKPRLYLNDGNGRLSKSTGGLPDVFLHAGCVIPADVDNDGDIDVFIGGRLVPGEYGESPASYLMLNDGDGRFVDATSRLLPSHELGMVTDAAWHDLNLDGKVDLIIAGEWMPLTIMIQDESGRFVDRTVDFGLSKTNGWWNTIEVNDFDGDGDMDFIAGNLGWNSRLTATQRTPVTLYVGDMDENGGIDHLLTYYNQGKEHPFISRDQLVKQVPSLKRDFLKYSTFRNVKLENIIPPGDVGTFLVKEVFTFTSVYAENLGDRFEIQDLPVEAQIFPIFSFLSKDLNEDGHLDLLAVGNLFEVQPDFGRYDAGYGLVMLGDGKGGFLPQTIARSGFLVKGQGRSIATVRTANEELIVVGRNNDTPLLFK